MTNEDFEKMLDEQLPDSDQEGSHPEPVNYSPGVMEQIALHLIELIWLWPITRSQRSNSRFVRMLAIYTIIPYLLIIMPLSVIAGPVLYLIVIGRMCYAEIIHLIGSNT